MKALEVSRKKHSNGPKYAIEFNKFNECLQIGISIIHYKNPRMSLYLNDIWYGKATLHFGSMCDYVLF